MPALTFPLPPQLIPGAVVNQPYNFLLPVPAGGIGPFHYQLGTYGHGDFGVFGSGFPPPGITVTPDGHVSGRPKAPTDQRGFGNRRGVYTFNICAIDDTTGESDCKQTNLVVIPPFQRFLTVTKGGTGTGTITVTPPGVACGTICTKVDGTFPDDGITRVKLTAKKDEGSIFTGWSQDCAGIQPCEFLMSQKMVRVLVVFTGSGTGRIIDSVPPGIQNCRRGSIEGCSAEFPVGITVNLRQEADRDSNFVQWETGCDEPKGQICIFTLGKDEDDHGVSARFDLAPVPAPVANFSWIPLSPTTNQSVQFTDTSMGPPTSWLWNFGDGTTSTLQNPTHSYSNAGRYDISLTVTNAAGRDTTARSITVSAPVVSLAFAITSAACRFQRSLGPNDSVFEVAVAGTAAGPVGARLVLPGLPGYLSESWTSSWGDGRSEISDRAANQPANTSWTATLIVGGRPGSSKTVEGYVRTSDSSQRVTDRRQLTCQ